MATYFFSPATDAERESPRFWDDTDGASGELWYITRGKVSQEPWNRKIRKNFRKGVAGVLFFTKMQANGNDFVVIENRDGRFATEILSAMALDVCTHKFSLGADGLLVLDPPREPATDFFMRIFNADGSEGEMCGNGARCLASFAHHHGFAGSHMVFGTLSGPVEATVNASSVRLHLGVLSLEHAEWNVPYTLQQQHFSYCFLTAGVPHCVISLADLEDFSSQNFVTFGRALRYDLVRFPQGTNVNFMEILDDHTLRIRTYERGVEDMTHSCGTGSVASALVGVRQFGLRSPVEVQTPGGINLVEVTPEPTKDTYRIHLQGEAHFVARGTLLDDGLNALRHRRELALL